MKIKRSVNGLINVFRINKGIFNKKIIIIIITTTTFLLGGFFCFSASFEKNFINQSKKSSIKIPNPLIMRNFKTKNDLAYLKKDKAKMTSKILSINDQEEKLLSEKELSKKLLEEKLTRILEKTPMEEMVENLLEKDQRIIALLVGIALKESSFGKFSPKKNGENCFNYWGYKGSYNPTSGGYSCFKSKQQAIDIVGNRLQTLVNQGFDTPEKLTIWKCGSSCAGHPPEAVNKWIEDISLYFWQILRL